MPIVDAERWRNFIANYPEANILQTAAWGDLKSDFGWQPCYVQHEQAGAQILFRKLPLGFHVGYIPKGPVGDDWKSLLPEIDRLCRQKRTIFLKIEPDVWETPQSSWPQEMQDVGVVAAPIQPRRTLVIDLQGNEADWLARMKQKTRYNVRLSQKKGVVVKLSQDVAGFHQLMLATGQRDGFGIHSLDYYHKAMELFSTANEMNNQSSCAMLWAEYEGRPLAALMVFARGKRSWYLYGASGNEDRNLMPTYLLQWEAMRWSAQQGCTEYDLWGVPDAEEEELETDFTKRSDGLWGVYRFKRGYGARLLRSVGAWDRVYMPLLYRLYLMLIKNRD